ncbi:2-keto-4-pentenoate hydratase [Microbacterium sp.]|uniref:2-keto-4-pentenoate hydratase n=1 Tax=Microbacterium sp. TaxID=51671 RepID=UPI003A8ADD42
MTSIRNDAEAVLATLADALHDAESAGTTVPPPSDAHELSVEDAYFVQRVNIARRLRAGERVVGRKIGLTSVAIQRQLGVDQPDFGVITDAMVVPDAGTLDAATLIAPRAEAEFAFRIGRDLPPSPDEQTLRDAVDGVAVAIEIIDSRVADWRITLVDTVADNASAARIAYGEMIPTSDELLDSLPETVISLRRNGQDAGAGPGSAVLGHPLTSLHWLAAAIGAYGDRFAAGDVVLAGAVAAAVPLAQGDHFEASAPGLPSVSFTVSRSEDER